ncbi:MAG TPA: hypothetical protein RMH85_25370 [Polyangiaceae bacterium LLY-WYZ-15_(1-7)]|nr:hypothetical protein [Myxococcales bacterium]MAT25808.1 hypothetical protein [Sandaracinus sp.]HJL04392.1 hypothetical protein [Polyangiaceae bacterium LLY-WYZ-15_(1-7)]MBJ70711.1 hypothetical protein [Sandaracinus sp.]HJL11831.1 hypothetical protein [Polyangiaceae bacterium LLY-WYZ-15_(1-7)]
MNAPRVPLALMLLAACGPCGGAPAEEAAEAEEVDPAIYFPMNEGDRWGLERDDGERSVLAVTDRTEGGAAVFFGSGRTSAERFAATDEGVVWVGPGDEVLAPLLDRPMELGHAWSYTLGDTRCEARYATVDAEAEVAGLELEACVEVRRRCVHPAGKPFPEETTEIREELYCPYVGRVKETLRFRPAMEGVPAERSWTVGYYRVADAPAPPLPERFDCDAVLLLPSDVQAACGPRLRPAGAARVEGACRFRFTAPGGILEVRAERHADEATRAELDAAVEAWEGEGAEDPEDEGDAEAEPAESEDGGGDGDGDAEAGADAALVAGAIEGRHLLLVRADAAACRPEDARRLLPLLQSLVRR